eukprot:scaffold162245_cov32-Tisochrysis_lutea.AAC.2
MGWEKWARATRYIASVWASNQSESVESGGAALSSNGGTAKSESGSSVIGSHTPTSRSAHQRVPGRPRARAGFLPRPRPRGVDMPSHSLPLSFSLGRLPNSRLPLHG